MCSCASGTASLATLCGRPSASFAQAAAARHYSRQTAALYKHVLAAQPVPAPAIMLF